jgi:hypothetical protein
LDASPAAPPSRKAVLLATWLCAGIVAALLSGLILIILNSGPTEVQTASVARGYDDTAGAIGAGTTFSPQDNPLHCVVTLVRAVKGTKVKISWIAIEAGGQQNYTLLNRELEMNGKDSTIDAYLTLQQPWPTGAYKIDIYLDGRLARTLFFNITATVRTGAGAYFVRSFQ